MANVEITLSAPLPDRTPDNALALVLSDDTTYGPDVTIPATDITRELDGTDSSVIVMVTLLDDTLLEPTEEIELALEIDSTLSPQPGGCAGCVRRA